MLSRRLSRPRPGCSKVPSSSGPRWKIAAPCGVLPFAWMDAVHCRLGMGSLPAEPIVLYLARSTSALYASFGAVYLRVAGDVPRYRPLLRLLAWIKVAFGAALVPISIS